jgi:hypothetical protein
MPRREQGPAAVESETHLLVLCQPRLTRRFLVLKLFAPFEAVGTVQTIGAKSYRVKGVSRLDHGKITTEPVNRLCRSPMGLTAVRNPQLPRVDVIQITVFL